MIDFDYSLSFFDDSTLRVDLDFSDPIFVSQGDNPDLLKARIFKPFFLTDSVSFKASYVVLEEFENTEGFYDEIVLKIPK